MNNFKPPYVGAAYYPEVWDKEELEKDIRSMLDLGINVVRIAEFAWTYMEPEEGRYDFSWLHRVVSCLTKSGIAVILGTPTATPPAWLATKYSDTLAVSRDGTPFVHGSRRHYCPNSETYRSFSKKIVERLAKEFSKDEGVVAWQIDNEFGCHINSCYCENCHKAFQKWLKRLYGSINKLNQAWGTGIWSQRYNNFSQVPLPKNAPHIHHPSLVYCFRHFMSASYADYARAQVEIIRKYSKAPITTNAMPAVHHRLDYEDLLKNIDFVSNDLYTPPERLWILGLEFDWMRPFKKKPYWVMETEAAWIGGLVPCSVFVHHPGALRAKMWFAYALGGEAVLFWPWRSHWSGQEMEYGAITYRWGDFTIAEYELRQVISELKNVKSFLIDTHPIRPEVAIHYSYPAMWILDYELAGSNLKYDDILYDYYKMFIDENVPRDIIYPGADVDGYKIVCSPFLPIIPDKLFVKMEKFVRAGGVWIVGPMSDFRTEDATAYKNKAYGHLEDLLGIHVRHRFPSTINASINFQGKERIKYGLWCDAFETINKNKVLGKYADGPAKGMASIVDCPIGKGHIVVLGVWPDTPNFIKWLIRCYKLESESGVKFCKKGILVCPRCAANGRLVGIIVVDIAGEGGLLEFSREGINILSNKKIKKKLMLPPYGVAIIKF